MKRGLAAVLSLCVGCAHGAVRVDTTPALAATPVRCVVVPPFERSGGLPGAGRSAAELAASQLERSGRMHVLEPAAWTWALGQFGGEFKADEPASLARLANHLGADAVLLGQVTEWAYSDDPQVYRDKQPRVALTLRLVRTKDATTLASVDLFRQPSRQGSHIALLSGLAEDVLADALSVMTAGLPPAGDEPCRFERMQRAAKADGQPAAPAAPAARAWSAARPAALSTAAVVLAERLQKGSTVPLRAVSFEYRTLDLQPGSEAELDVVAELLRGYPDLGVAVVVHTDNVGEPADLRAFTLRQAEVIQAALLERAVQAWQVTVEGMGGDEPILPNINRRNRQVNRRVELRLVVPPSGGW